MRLTVELQTSIGPMLVEAIGNVPVFVIGPSGNEVPAERFRRLIEQASGMRTAWLRALAAKHERAPLTALCTS